MKQGGHDPYNRHLFYNTALFGLRSPIYSYLECIGFVADKSESVLKILIVRTWYRDVLR